MSKKSVTIPIPSCRMVGWRRPVAPRAWAIQNSTKAIPAAPRSAIRIAFGASNGLVHGADRGRLCPRDQARPGGHRATAAAHHQLDAGVDVAVVAGRTAVGAGDRLLAD